MARTVLLTGGCGFIGSAVVRLAIADTDTMIVNVDAMTYAAMPEAVAEAEKSGRYVLEKTDIREMGRVAALFEKYRPDAVMHLAAESHVDRSISSPGDFITTNVMGTFNLLQVSMQFYNRLEGDKKAQFRFHHVSTDEVYGSLELEDPAFSEVTPYRPNSPYSASKASSDHLVRAWHETYGLPTVTTNCSNNYGPWQFPEKLIPVMISKMCRGEALPIYGNGENIRDWLYVEDHARALWLVLGRGDPGETYNIGGNAEMTNIGLIHRLCALMDDRFPDRAPHSDLMTFVTDRPGHDKRYAIDATKIHDRLDWKPQETFESGLAKTVDWYLEHESWWQGILSGAR